jgi:tetratricopeptide (TPR) repeat protein
MHRVMHKAHQLLEKGEQKKALAQLDKYASSHPDKAHYQFFFMRGVLCYQLKKTDRAKQDFQKTVQLRPCHGPGLRNLAAVMYEKGKPLAAAELALKAHHWIKPEQPDLLYEAAVFYLSAKKSKKSVALLEKLAKRPKPKKAWLTALARVYMELKKPEKAKPVVERLLTMAPQDEMLWRLLASLQLNLGKQGKAAAALEVAYRLKPPEKAGWRNLAGLYRAANIPLKAAYYYEKAFGSNPTAKELDTLTGVYLQGNYHKKALVFAQKACQRAPTHKRKALVGRIFLQRKKYKKAYEYFMAAAKLKDPRGKHSLMAGYCAMQMEQLEKAETAFSLARTRAAKGSTTAKEADRALKAVRNYQQAQKEQENLG